MAIGRRPAMILTLSLVCIGAAGSTAMFGNSPTFIYAWYTFFHFLCGVGIGGIYPLAAVFAAEASTEAEEQQSAEERRLATTKRVGWSFFFQQPGALAPYIMALILLAAIGENHLLLQARIVLGIGIIPATIPIVLTLLSANDAERTERISATEPSQIGESADPEAHPLASSEQVINDTTELRSVNWARQQKEWPLLVKGCVGCALSWFLYDVSYYGTAVFTPVILKTIFKSSSLLDNAWQSAVVVVFSVPGTAIGVFMCQKFACWWTGFTGFLAMAAGFLILGAMLQVGDAVNDYVKFAFFIVLSMLTASGPSVTTYVTPTLIFPSRVRSTFHGISAAGAKFGALAGTLMYPLISEQTSVAFVLFMQVGFSLMGAAAVFFLIPRKDEVITGEYPALLEEEKHD